MATGSGPLKRFRISNHKGIAEFECQPDGRSFRLVGANGAGKSAVLDALTWIVDDDGSDATMRNGAAERRGEMVFGDYLIIRSQKRGKKPNRNMAASALGKIRGALARVVFSAMGEREQEATLRKLAPSLDVSKLDAEIANERTARTRIGQQRDDLDAQARGVVIPDAPTEAGEERPIMDVVDVAAIAAKKGDVERVRAENNRVRDQARALHENAVSTTRKLENAHHFLEEARRKLKEMEAQAEEAARQHQEAVAAAQAAEEAAAALTDPDTTAIDAEIVAAKQTNAAARAETEARNRSVRAAQQAQREREAAEVQRADLALKAASKAAEYKAATDRIRKLEADRAAQIGAAKLPIAGLSLVDGRAMFDDGKHGPVPISDAADSPNAGERMRINVAIHAALGHELIPVRNASLMDDETLRSVEALAEERGIQLVPEIVRTGAPLTVEIAEAGADAANLDL